MSAEIKRDQRNGFKERVKSLTACAFLVVCGALSGNYGTEAGQAEAAPKASEQSGSLTGKDVSVEELIRKVVAEKLPSAQVAAVAKTPITDLYQVSLTNGEIFHIHEGGQYILAGDMFKFKAGGGIENLTEKHRSSERVALIKGLADQKMVSFEASGSGGTKADVYVFTDTDCGYCRKFHAEVAELNKQGVAVHYLAWPRAGVKSNTGQTMVKIWCSRDPQGAMTLAKQGRPVPDSADCQHPVEAQLALGAKLGVRGTPAVFLADGRKVGGYLTAQELLTAIER